MKKVSKPSGFRRILVFPYTLIVFIAVCQYAMIGVAPAAPRATGKDTSALFAVNAEAQVDKYIQHLVTAPDKHNRYTIFLPVVTGRTCSDILLSGLVYNDLNGNGIHDTAYSLGDLRKHPDGFLGAAGPSQEPPVVGAVIRAGGAKDVTDSNGRYVLCLPAGTHAVTVEAASYRVRFPSIRGIKDLTAPITVTLSLDTSLDLSLGLGPLTLPYLLSSANIFRQGSYVDIDPTYGQVGVYNSYPEDCYWWHCTGDAHRGIDYYAPSGTLVVAGAPGLVWSTAISDAGDLMVVILHTDYEDKIPDGNFWARQGFQTSYQHLGGIAEGIEPGNLVERGQPLGYLHNYGHESHLHTDAQLDPYVQAGSNSRYVDFYRDLYRNELVFLTHDTGYGYSISISQGSPGFWTADNLPSFAHE